jgi:preprotein translocase subunit SecA
MRIFGSDKIKGLMVRMGLKDDEPIEHKMISNAIAKAQKRVEGHNFDIRKHLLDFDNVMNEQRKVIYKIRREILNDEGNTELVHEMIEDVANSFIENYRPKSKVTLNEWDWDAMNEGFKNFYSTEKDISISECSEKFSSKIQEYIIETTKNLLENKFNQYEPEQVKLALREILLGTFDQLWKDHLLNMDNLKEGINLRSHGQKDPLVEYKREAFSLYEGLKYQVRETIIQRIFNARLYTKEEVEELKREQQRALEAQLQAHKDAQAAQEMASGPIERTSVKVGRNDPCPCGSGKKFKHCHGA